jgi:iron complex outermembrane receptor protein
MLRRKNVKANKFNLCFFLIAIWLIPKLHAKSNVTSINRLEVRHVQSSSDIHSVLTQDNVQISPDITLTKQGSLSDLLGQVAGVEANGQGGLFQSFNVRGFSRWRIKTELDGIPILTDRRAGNAVAFLPPALISSVYLQKGPTSAIYGSGAMGGVVSLISEPIVSELSLSVQPIDQHNHIQLSYAGDSFSSSIVSRQAKNSQSANGVELNNQYAQTAGTAHLFTEWQDISVHASVIASQGEDIGKSSSELESEQISDYPEDQHLLTQLSLSDDEMWKLQFYAHQQEWQSDTTRLDSQTFESRVHTTYQALTLGSLGILKLGDTKLGMEWIARRDVDISEQGLDQQEQVVYKQSVVQGQGDNLSVFMAQHWQVHALSLNLGVRLDWVELENIGALEVDRLQKQDDFFSSSLSGAYSLSEHNQINFEIARSFRFPTLSELFFNGDTPRGITLGNVDLQPEKSMGYQVSLKHVVNQSVSISANLYHYDVANYIERYSTITGSRSYRNSDEVTIHGAELVVDLAQGNAFSSNVSVQLQQGKDADSAAIDDIQPAAVKWALSWSPNVENWQGVSIQNQLKYQFAKSTVGESEVARKDQLIWDVSANWAIAKTMSLKLSLFNVLNRSYFGALDEDAPLQPQRTLQLGWVWQYD